MISLHEKIQDVLDLGRQQELDTAVTQDVHFINVEANFKKCKKKQHRKIKETASSRT